jgi:hypothetical protein
MGIPELGTLVEVDLREAWSHEAYSFTPWLSEHLSDLSRAIGVQLELEGTEVEVEGFAADILARNAMDDSRVLIENQLNRTDHSHLGQIMTYLAGLQVNTVIWVAADFREPHLAALKWLNDNTFEQFAFFAVQVKAVRIGDSAIAPVFEVVARPNYWERSLQTVVQKANSDLGQFRRDFWTHYVNRFPDELERCPAQGLLYRWRVLEDIGLVVAAIVAKTSVGVYVRGLQKANQEDTYNLLYPHAESLSMLLGTEIGSLGSQYLFFASYPEDTSDRSTWDELTDWLHSTVDHYESSLRETLTRSRTDAPAIS